MINPDNLIINSWWSKPAGWTNDIKNGISITHIPSGIIINWEGERSQYKNKAVALKLLGKALLDSRTFLI
tara:strand:- start:163 stop:372 length:210 start_codon:yes stop_codon:yes gene_type:complete